MSTLHEPGGHPPADGGAAGAEALMAGTMALMTAYAKSCCDGCRALIARRIAGNLAELSQHAAVPPAFRVMAQSLRGVWERQLDALGAQVQQEAAAEAAITAQAPRPHPAAPVTRLAKSLWHTTPETLQ